MARPHRDKVREGEHEAIIDPRTWEAAQAIIQGNSKGRGANTRANMPPLLKGLIKSGYDTCTVRSVPAGVADILAP